MKVDEGAGMDSLDLRLCIRNPLRFFILTNLILLLSLWGSTRSESRVGIDGSREPCSNEGEIVPVESIKDMNCFKCICKNGFVECQPEYECPPVDNCYMQIVKPKNECCSKCKGCTFNGARYPSDSTWRDKHDACLSHSCEASVVTSSRVTCYTPCENPRPPKEGECCPTCDGCVINGQQVMEGRDVTTPEDPCLKCSCSKGRLTCSKRACPVLQCPIWKQIRTAGECCPKCDSARPLLDKEGTNCVFNNAYPANGTNFAADLCSNCTCINGTSVCQRRTCPVLECPQEMQIPAGVAKVKGKLTITSDDGASMCCPRCPPVEKVTRTCTYAGKAYKEGDSWKLDACKSCQCRNGEPRCAMERCPSALQQNGVTSFQSGFNACPPGQKLIRIPGQCCPQCVENDGVCTVFGDPHYRTFDGAFFSHRGSCKYLLAADCSNSTIGALGAFSIRVTNGGTRKLLWRVKRRKKERQVRQVLSDDLRKSENDATTKSGPKVKMHKLSRRSGEGYVTAASAWTRTITLRIGDELKVNLGRRQRVKVNGKRVDLPFFMQGLLSIDKSDGNIKVDTNIGISLLWDGVSFLEVSASTNYKGKLCGLCGNFNSIGRDDLVSRGETIEQNQERDIRKFAESWRVGGKKACSIFPRFQTNQKTPNNKQKKNKLKPDLSSYYMYQEYKCDKRMRKQANVQCKRLKDSELFGGCDSRLNPQNFMSACIQDVCECQARANLQTVELTRVTRSHEDHNSTTEANTNKFKISESILKNSFKLLNDDSSTVKTVNRHYFTDDDEDVTKRVDDTFRSHDILKDFMKVNGETSIWKGARRQKDFKELNTVVVGCHCAAFMAYARSCSRLGAAPDPLWKTITGCERKNGQFDSRWQKPQRRRKIQPYKTKDGYESSDVTFQIPYGLKERLISNEGVGKRRKHPPPELY